VIPIIRHERADRAPGLAAAARKLAPEAAPQARHPAAGRVWTIDRPVDQSSG
jgi:hypothetical protein